MHACSVAVLWEFSLNLWEIYAFVGVSEGGHFIIQIWGKLCGNFTSTWKYLWKKCFKYDYYIFFKVMKITKISLCGNYNGNYIIIIRKLQENGKEV